MRQELPHPFGPVATVASPLRLSDSPVDYDRGPPLLGEHTQEVLREKLGLGGGEIARMVSANILG
jgi:crotonobetainyl-CoA:carnitine CoA-transferase CaiB-like acyl-CoA transferase